MTDQQPLQSIVPAEPGWTICQGLPEEENHDPIIAWVIELDPSGVVHIDPVVPFHGRVPRWDGMMFRTPDGQYLDEWGLKAEPTPARMVRGRQPYDF